MSEPSQQRSRGGCFSKLLFLILLLAVVGLGVGVFYAVQPQSLTDVGGYTASSPATQVRDMRVVLQNSIQRGYNLSLSEAEINQWLAQTLVSKQGGVLAEQVRLNRVLVRFEEGYLELIMTRTFLGKPFTSSMFLQVERMEEMKGTVTEIRLHGGPYHKDFPNPTKGGRIGQLVVPQGVLLLTMPAFQKLAELFKEEIDLGFREMARIKIEKDRIIFDPREPLGDQGMPLNF